MNKYFAPCALILACALLLGLVGCQPELLQSPIPTRASPLQTPPSPTVEVEPTAASDTWPTLTPPPTPLPPPARTPVIKPSPTPKLLPTRLPIKLSPTPVGPRPAKLQSIWFPYFPDPISPPQLRAVQIDQIGRRWGQSENLVGLDLRAGYPGPRLMGLYSSPDGKRIAADVFYGDNGSVWLIEPVSGHTQRILKDKESMGHFITWSPDGQKLLIRAESTKGEIWLIDISTGRSQRLDLPIDQFGSTTTQSAVFSPDGSRIAYVIAVQPTASGQVPYIELWTMDPDGSDKQQLLRDSGAGVVEGSLLWSSTMNHLVYVKQLDANSPNASGELWGLNLSTHAPRRFDTEIVAEWPSRPVLSPNGETIAFVKSTGDLWTFDLRTNQSKQTHSPGGKGAANPVWSPGGTFLAFAANQADYSVILIASIDGAQVYAVAGPAPLGSPIAWLP
jgi:Tol biopolymer transport system component